MSRNFSIIYLKMFRRLLFGQPARNRFGEAIYRHIYKDDSGDSSHGVIPGGGLEKLQGGIKEEKYFNDQDLELLAKMRAEGSKKLKCENCVGNWTEFEKIVGASSEPAALRETCSHNRHKDCKEEAYFMNEQTLVLKQLSEKLKSNAETSRTNIATDNDNNMNE